MTEHTIEITKEQFEEIMEASDNRGFVPAQLETKYFSISVLCGYGLYGDKVFKKDGKYYLWYKTGDSCD